MATMTEVRLNARAAVTQSVRRRIRRQAPARALTLSLVLLLGLATLLPLAAPGVAAEEQEDENLITELAPEVSEEEVVAIEPAETPEGSDPDNAQDLLEGDAETSVEEDLVAEVVAEGDPEPGTAEIFIQKRRCRAGFDAYANATDFNALASNCTDFHSGVVFGVGAGAADYATQAVGEYIHDGVEFTQVPATAVIIYELMPDGYGEPIVICGRKLVEQSGPPGSFEWPPVVAGNQINYQLGAGERLECTWFNVPLGDAGSVTINKHGCPAGFDAYAADIYALALNCHEGGNGVRFVIWDGMTEYEQTTGQQGLPNIASFDDVRAAGLKIAELLPNGYGDPIVFCGSETAPGSGLDLAPQTVVAPGEDSRYIEYRLASGETLYCDWFNVPYQEYGSITISKWTCPVGYDPYAWDANPELDCPAATDGVTFTLEQPVDGDQMSDTGDSIPGAVYFGGLTPGVYGVTETLPAGIAYGFVVGCSGLQVPVILPYPLYHTDSGMPFYLELVGGEDIVCSWYNVPEHEEWNGKLTVIKYWCEGTTYSEHECALYGGGAKFALSPAEGGGPPYALETGVDGRASVEISGVGTSAWLLKELNGKPCYVEVSKTEQGAIIVEHGYETVVKVFNCGPDKTTTTTTTTTTTKTGAKQPPVTKFPNTGAGTMSVHGDGESTAITLLLLSVQVALIAAGSLIGFGRTRAVVARVGERR